VNLLKCIVKSNCIIPIEVFLFTLLYIIESSSALDSLAWSTGISLPSKSVLYIGGIHTKHSNTIIPVQTLGYIFSDSDDGYIYSDSNDGYDRLGHVSNAILTPQQESLAILEEEGIGRIQLPLYPACSAYTSPGNET
jgi:hypothetical protein